MKFTHILFALAALSLPVVLHAQPVVSNVTFIQQPDGAGSTEIVVTYDLSTPDGPSTTTLLYSLDAAPFTPALNVSGDVGPGLTTGTLIIDWAVANDLPNIQSNNLVVRVVAEDGVPELLEFVSVPAGTFTMGRTMSADDTLHGSSIELPNHEVTLDDYDIGKFEVTNEEFATVMNWALANGYLADNTSGSAYGGSGNVYLMAQDVTSTRQLLFDTVTGSSHSQIEWTGSAFVPRTRNSKSMENHPVVRVTWFGAVAFCNFLSEMEGKPLAYNLTTWDLVDKDPEISGIQFVAGYRLPTESEWERAAAWDGSKHWTYSFVSDTLTGKNRANYREFNYINVNPVGLTSDPRTSPVGWFNGVNVSPNGSITTINSPSPVGAYDMTGNVIEWCHDWYGPFDSLAKSNPTGPASGTDRILRGGGWNRDVRVCRTATRGDVSPGWRSFDLGFRVAATR